jgi:hypothetical protein
MYLILSMTAVGLDNSSVSSRYRINKILQLLLWNGILYILYYLPDII